MTELDQFCSNCGKSGHLAGQCRMNPDSKHRIRSTFEKEKISDQGQEHLLKSGVPVGMVLIPQEEFDQLIKPCRRCEKLRTRNRERQQKSRLKRVASA